MLVVVASHHRVPFGFWLCCLLLSSLHISCAASVSFDYDFSQPGGYNPANFSLQGDAYFDSKVIQLTAAVTKTNSVGRASYVQPVAIWDEATGELASFTSTFTFLIVLDKTRNSAGDGMAFFLAHYPASIPSSSNGGNLGLFSRSQLPGTNATGANRVVAVEFDTFLNKQYDTSANHMGIDINSLISSKYINTTTPGSTLTTSGTVMACTVSYDNSTQLLAADLQIGGTRYRVDIVADLRQLLPSVVAVGFSGATGAADELHQVLSWSFDSTLDLLPPPSPPAQSQYHHAGSFWKSHKWGIAGGSVAAAFLLVVALVCYNCFKRRSTRKKTVDDEKKIHDKGETENDKPQDEEEKPAEVVPPHIPKQFSCDELVAATEGFAQERRLGKGGFATVYKGQLTARWVAIKRFELTDDLRKKSFDDEITAISLGRHRYLIQLLGWCKDANNLMLVYELVPGGNLHEHLHQGKSWLPWSTRNKIIRELAEVLRYLHQDCPGYCVVHGDLKPANILLDSDYTVKLSDFGLARLVDHGIGPKTTDFVVGTLGYLDPDFRQNGKRSNKTDVYSFGIVLLEIVSGKVPAAADHQTTMVTQLLIDVHKAYCGDTILDAADSKLREESTSDDHAQMERVLRVGLWCAHLDPSQRPAIAEAWSALQSRDVDIPPPSSQFEARQSVHDADGISY